MKNSLQPINPMPHLNEDNVYPGLNKREYFAAKAMQTLIAVEPTVSTDYILKYLDVPKDQGYTEEYSRIFVAKMSVAYADALLEELDNNKVPK